MTKKKKRFYKKRQQSSQTCHTKLLSSISMVQLFIEEPFEIWVNRGFTDIDGLINYSEDALSVIASEYNISLIQAVIFCVMLNHIDEPFISEAVLAQDLKESKIGVFKYQKDIDALKKKI